MSYFKSFSPTLYKFGNENSTSITTDLSQYIDLLDQIKSKDLFLEDYIIPANERPDQTSFSLYGTTDYYWTFFLVNDELRENGWPLTLNEVHNAAQKRYPHRLVTVALLQPDVVDYYDEDNKPIYRTKLVGTAPDQFAVGETVVGNVTGTRGTIIKRDLSLGTFTIDTINAVSTSEIFEELVVPNSNGVIELARTDVLEAETFTQPLNWVLLKDGEQVSAFKVDVNPFGRKVSITGVSFDPTSTYHLTYYVNTKNLTDGAFQTGEELSYINPAGTATSMIVHGDMPQYLGTHHWEDADGNWIDIDPLTQTKPTGAVEVTMKDYLTQKNESLRQIKLIKPETIQGIVNEFNDLLRA
jgi:hypothetical protein